MKTITEYLSTNVAKPMVKQKPIYATNETIHQIVKSELDRLGHDADLNHIDVSEVTIMGDLFNLDEKIYGDLNPDISQWDVSKVEDMHSMFFICSNFNQDLSQWDVSNMKDMRYMFYKCRNFNQDLSRWNVGNVKYMQGMFYECKNFNQNLSKWNVSKVEDIRIGNIFSMFDKCPIKENFKPKFN